MLTDQFSRRFRELQKESDLIPFDSGNLSTYVPAGSWEGWATSAKQSLAEGYKDVAAVLASAALEDSLKRYATANGLNVDNGSMMAVINALKSKGLVSGTYKTLLNAMPKIRNYAMHADWEKISEPDVKSVIGFVEQFLLTKFSHG